MFRGADDPIFQSTRPVRGGTTNACANGSTAAFQSTRPVRGGTAAITGRTRTAWKFQSTRPVRGGTITGLALALGFTDFNPPAPCGAGQHLRTQLNDMMRISIHPPRAGRDRNIRYVSKSGCISIHPPRAGRDGCPLWLCRMAGIFQSTRPVRGGTCKGCEHAYESFDFNPPAPCGAGPAETSQNFAHQRFQSTRPVRGGTILVKFIVCIFLFQSTRPVRGGTSAIKYLRCP